MNNLAFPFMTTETSTTPFNFLPSELLQKVFSFLLPADRGIARTVCQLWNHVIGETFRFDQFREIIQFNTTDPAAHRPHFSENMRRLANYNPAEALRALQILQKKPANHCDTLIGSGLAEVMRAIACASDLSLKANLQKNALEILLAIPEASTTASPQNPILISHEELILRQIFTPLTGADIDNLISLAETIPGSRSTTSQRNMKTIALASISNGLLALNTVDKAVEMIHKLPPLSPEKETLVKAVCAHLVKSHELQRAIAIADQSFDKTDPVQISALIATHMEICTALVAMGKTDEAIQRVAASPLVKEVSSLCSFASLLIEKDNFSAARVVADMITPEMQTDPQTASDYELLTQRLTPTVEFSDEEFLSRLRDSDAAVAEAFLSGLY